MKLNLQKTCTSKRKYRSRHEALQAIEHGTGKLQVYLCPFWHGRRHWHIGHPVGWKRAQERRFAQLTEVNQWIHRVHVPSAPALPGGPGSRHRP